MRTRTLLSMLTPAVLACSEREPSPTELRPEFAVSCTPPRPTVAASPASVTKAPNSAGSATFFATNNCTVTLTGMTFTSSRTGAVTSVGTPNPATLATLAPGAGQKVTVSYNVGPSGSGTVVLTARLESDATSSGSQTVTVTQAGTGVPFGPFGLYKSSGSFHPIAPFKMTVDYMGPTNIIRKLNLARDSGIKVVTAMAGGGKSQYLTNGKFDYKKWKDTMDTFNTAAIKTAVANGVTNGTILFNSLMDEPNHPGWGGVMTHALLDSMSRYVKGIFPTLKTGVVVIWYWEKDSMYHDVDVMLSQYDVPTGGSAKSFKDSAVLSAQRQNVGLMFSMNTLHGGGQSYGTPMTAAQMQAFGDTLLASTFACGLAMWRWDSAFMASSANRAAFNHLASTAAARPAKVCGK
jgi:hypothetical protein